MLRRFLIEHDLEELAGALTVVSDDRVVARAIRVHDDEQRQTSRRNNDGNRIRTAADMNEFQLVGASRPRPSTTSCGACMITP